jgi:hypothetical protein
MKGTSRLLPLLLMMVVWLLSSCVTVQVNQDGAQPDVPTSDSLLPDESVDVITPGEEAQPDGSEAPEEATPEIEAPDALEEAEAVADQGAEEAPEVFLTSTGEVVPYGAFLYVFKGEVIDADVPDAETPNWDVEEEKLIGAFGAYGASIAAPLHQKQVKSEIHKVWILLPEGHHVVGWKPIVTTLTSQSQPFVPGTDIPWKSLGASVTTLDNTVGNSLIISFQPLFWCSYEDETQCPDKHGGYNHGAAAITNTARIEIQIQLDGF